MPTPAIPHINVPDENTRRILQAMKEQIAALLKRVEALEAKVK